MRGDDHNEGATELGGRRTMKALGLGVGDRVLRPSAEPQQEGKALHRTSGGGPCRNL